MPRSKLSLADEDASPLMEINTTPLIDVMLVLLITLIVTMPSLTHSVKLGLGARPDSTIRQALHVEVEFDGAIYLNGAGLAGIEQLESKFKVARAGTVEPEVRIDPNLRAPYDMVAKVMAAAQRNGIRNVGFVGNEKYAREM